MPQVKVAARPRWGIPRRTLLALGIAVAPSLAGAQQAARPDFLTRLIVDLGSTNDSLRTAASRALVALGPAAVPVLRPVLASPDRLAAFGAAHTLTRLGDTGVSVLVEGLRDSTTRRAAAAALRFEELQPEPVIRGIALLLGDSRADVRALAISVLPAGESLSGNPIEYARAEGLLRRALHDSDAEVREAGVARLELSPSFAGVLGDVLVLALEDHSSAVRGTAAFALAGVDSLPGDAVAALVRHAETDPDAAVQWRSVRALGWLGSRARGAVPALVRATGASTPEVRADAARSLGSIGVAGLPDSAANGVVEALEVALRDTVDYVAHAAVGALSTLGPAGVQPLIDAVAVSSDSLAQAVLTVLGHATPSLLVEKALLDALADSRELVRDAATTAVAGLGPDVLPELRQLRRSRSAVTRNSAARAIAYLARATRVPLAEGCYSLQRGVWTAGPEIGGDSIFITPPPVVRFTFVKHRAAIDATGPAMELVAVGGPEVIMGPGAWQPIPGRQAVIVLYSNGYSGVVLDLAAVGQGELLRGTAETFWDFPRAAQTAPVTARRVPCPSDAKPP